MSDCNAEYQRVNDCIYKAEYQHVKIKNKNTKHVYLSNQITKPKTLCIKLNPIFNTFSLDMCCGCVKEEYPDRVGFVIFNRMLMQRRPLI